jgi:hypothetical protein
MTLKVIPHRGAGVVGVAYFWRAVALSTACEAASSR